MDSSESLPVAGTFSIGDYFSVLRRRKWLILLAALVGIGGSVAYVRQQTPQFQSTVSLLGTASSTQSANGGRETAGTGPSDSTLVTFPDVAKCASVLMRNPQFVTHPTGAEVNVNQLCAQPVLDAMPLRAGLGTGITVSTSKGPFTMQFVDPSARRAQLGAQAFAESFIRLKTVTAWGQINRSRSILLDDQRQLRAQLASIDTKIVQVQAQIQALITAGTPPLAQKATLSNLQAQHKTVQDQLGTVSDQLLSLNPAKVTPPRILSPASLPKAPFRPQKTLIASFGLVGGLILGIVLAFVLERSDQSLRGPSELASILGAPVLAVIPKVKNWRKKKEPRLVTRDHPTSVPSEAYRSLRTSVLFDAARNGTKVILVTAGSAAEGKTTTAANLAVSLADGGKQVILVSADLRQPRAHAFFGLPNGTGLSRVLSGEQTVQDVILDSGVDNLLVIPGGPVPERAGDLLERSMGRVIAELREMADLIVLDSSPLLLVADAKGLIPMVDGLLYVADPDRCTRRALQHAREELSKVNAPLMGSVLNNLNPRKAKRYRYYGYTYPYGSYGMMVAYGIHPDGDVPPGQKNRRSAKKADLTTSEHQSG